ncbi:MAG TPA: hypothetical protein VGC41_04960 [Kofleriaceae bacterium]
MSDDKVTEMDPLDAPATKRDLENFATKQDLERFATKQELASAIAPLATKQELAAAIAPLATKQELAAAIAPLATKQELATEIAAAIAPLATKQELASTKDELVSLMIALRSDMMNGMERLGDRLYRDLAHLIRSSEERLRSEFRVHDDRLNDHERRIRMLED